MGALRIKKFQACAVVLLSLLSAGVSAQGPGNELQQARAAEAAGDLLGAAAAYERAALADAPLAAEHLLHAAELTIRAGDSEQARSLIAALRRHALDPVQSLRSTLVLARAEVLDGRPEAALRSLPDGAGPVQSLAADVLAVRADAQFAVADPVSATTTLVQRESWLGNDPQRLSINRQQLWMGLTAIPLGDADHARFASVDVTSRGWLELAWTLQLRGSDGLSAWRQQYPGHPGIVALASVRRGGAAELPANSIAALLPLSGPLAPLGQAVRDGLLYAYFDEARPRPTLRFYDTRGTSADALAAYRRAIADGVGALIGPLSKPELTAILNAGLAPPQLLSLNQVAGLSAPGLIQLSLAPEDEAGAAARDALAHGLRRAVVLAPDSDWGRRVASAFVEQLRAGGGIVREQRSYRSGVVDNSVVIRDLLNFEEAQARNEALQAALGKPVEFQEHRRQDIDLIFVAASSADAQTLVPQLRFYRADDLPIYSTAAVYGGQSASVERVRFCDMPWSLDQDGAWRAERSQAEGQFESARGRGRLFALGIDAWLLSRQAEQGRLAPGAAVEGATGRLQLSAMGVMERRLECAELINGVPQSVFTGYSGRPPALPGAP